jgi:Ran GTPase-activating protein (RanGAP) involved in mRNA processing and transport
MSLSQFIEDQLNLRNLTEINCSKQAVNDKKIEFLLKCLPDNIVELNLRDNDIRDEGAKYIAKFLAKCNTIKELDLRANPITEEGCNALRQSFIAHGTSLHTLRISNSHEGNFSQSDPRNELEFDLALGKFKKRGKILNFPMIFANNHKKPDEIKNESKKVNLKVILLKVLCMQCLL